jgi:ATP-binding cassette subfamily G (WHITE) protein 2
MLTVYETLHYTAALRMSSACSAAEREARVAEVLLLMGIDYCRDVIVGDSRNKGVSGGERKRLCVAMELLNRPKLLFLDEPTSGLDSTTAFDLMQTLKDLADKGECTVVCTIHQPQTKIYNLLDNLMLMKKGSIVYQGSCEKADHFFALQGYPCPEKMNPADHLLDLISTGTKMVSDEEGGRKSVEIKNMGFAVPINMEFGIERDDFTVRAVHNWFFQFATLFQRTWQERIRRWDTILVNILVTCIVATFISMGAWNNLGNNGNGQSKVNAILFFCVIHQGVVSTLQGTYAFPIERALMLRERSAGAYYVSAYFFAKTTVDFLVMLINPLLFSA